MGFSFLLGLALIQSAPGAQTGVPADSYADSATRTLVQRTRAARDRNERLVTSYTASVTQRMGAGIRALSRDRMLFHQELAAKISWKRDGKSTIEVTGARQAIPVAMRKDQVPGDLDASVRWLVINPAEDYLGMIGTDSDGFVYPLKEGGELDYRFAIGDTSIITLQSGKRIRLVELEVTPRRSEWRLMSGSLWFDADTYGLVRALFRPARPYELQRDMEDNDREDLPSWVNATGEIKYITMEYALHNERWWMLRYAALDAVGNVGSWLGIPLKFERTYDDYEVEGGTPPPPGSRFRPAGTVRRDTTGRIEYDSEAAIAARRARRAAFNVCIDKAGSREESEACRRRRWRNPDTTLTVIVPDDTLSLLTSPTLGPPILEMGDLISDSEIKGLADMFKQLPGAPIASRVELPKGFNAVLRNARYNRVEALSLGLNGSLKRGSFTLDGLGRIGVADGVPNGELGMSLSGGSSRFRLGGYRRLAAVNPDTKPFGAVNSVWGVIAQRDDGDYFRSLGVELTGQNTLSGGWSWRLFAENQKAAFVETDFSIPHLFNGDNHFRSNVVADRADQIGASFTLRGNHPLSRTIQIGGETTFEAQTGDFEFGRGSATVRAIVTPRALLAVALEASAGTSRGTVPTQGRFYLGGPATLRGYDGAVTSGESYWRARAEVGNAFPGFRLAIFSDLGWAGERSAFRSGKPLLGSGVGVSLLDGLVRLDLARAMRGTKGWRFDLYFDGRL
ncbi:MAG: hypothetical protein HOP28_00375 [Gemmatimonadales bacterium]|nr:hypothetical protein [Gemmatimonadales bacterium]